MNITRYSQLTTTIPSLPPSPPPLLPSDPELQYQFYGEYARNNSYGIDLVSAEIAEKMDAGTEGRREGGRGARDGRMHLEDVTFLAR